MRCRGTLSCVSRVYTNVIRLVIVIAFRTLCCQPSLAIGLYTAHSPEPVGCKDMSASPSSIFSAPDTVPPTAQASPAAQPAQDEPEAETEEITTAMLFESLTSIEHVRRRPKGSLMRDAANTGYAGSYSTDHAVARVRDSGCRCADACPRIL